MQKVHVPLLRRRFVFYADVFDRLLNNIVIDGKVFWLPYQAHTLGQPIWRLDGHGPKGFEISNSFCTGVSAALLILVRKMHSNLLKIVVPKWEVAQRLDSGNE